MTRKGCKDTRVLAARRVAQDLVRALQPRVPIISGKAGQTGNHLTPENHHRRVPTSIKERAAGHRWIEA